MKEFRFKAPTLVDAAAEASLDDKEAWHDAPAVADYAAKTKRLALWLSSKLVAEGLAAGPPSLDEGGWLISVNADASGFVLCCLSAASADCSSFYLIVTKIGGASEDPVVEAVARGLGKAGGDRGFGRGITPSKRARCRDPGWCAGSLRLNALGRFALRAMAIAHMTPAPMAL